MDLSTSQYELLLRVYHELPQEVWANMPNNIRDAFYARLYPKQTGG